MVFNSLPPALSMCLTANIVSLASTARVLVDLRAFFERKGGGRGFPVMGSPLVTESPLPCG